jgi:hypothetical protein
MSIQNNWNEREKKRFSGLPILYDYTMGVLWIGVGLFFIFSKSLGIELMKSDPLIDNIFGIVGVAYGIFRLYRGYKKQNIGK